MNENDRVYVEKHQVRRVLIAILLLFTLSACSSSQTIYSPLTKSSSVVDVRVVKHIMGETVVPAHPQRVAILFNGLLEPAFALGVKPIAAPKLAVLELRQLVSNLENIEDINSFSPNLEKLLQLKPDLILGYRSHQNIYPLLSHIAPTVLATFDPLTPWKGFLAFTADALGKTQSAQQIMANYYARLAQVKAGMGRDQQTTVVSVCMLRESGLFLLQKATLAGVILNDAGIKRPLNQLFDVQASLGRFGYSLFSPVSRELLHEIDGDILFLFVQDTVGDQDLNPALEQLRASPLWSKLKVVQKNQVFIVGVYWVGNGPISANRVIDDLFRYLVK
ncbi:MAG: iron-siderophore ABC transporter substrate-binding protein [Nostoc sp.]|uniref:iron-siderophore ABC transporter substrate-binding protein n=1 Tax=Nostoc sp. TaxID=1180 RepID=UPI002FF761A0